MAEVLGIYTTPEPTSPMIAQKEALAIPGRGLDGDRYCAGGGTFSPEEQDPDHEITLIEAEQIEKFNQDVQGNLSMGDPRRNVVTRGVLLNDLVGRQFYVGEVLIRGIRLCEPCKHLATLVDSRVLSELVNRGGLRAQILTEGWIHVGDTIRVVEETNS